MKKIVIPFLLLIIICFAIFYFQIKSFFSPTEVVPAKFSPVLSVTTVPSPTVKIDSTSSLSAEVKKLDVSNFEYDFLKLDQALSQF